MPQDYSWITNDMFDRMLAEIVEEQRSTLLSIPGVWEAASEEFNNEALELGGDFEEAIQGILTGLEAETILSIPGMYEVLSEEFNNAVLQELEDERETSISEDYEEDLNWREDERGWVKLKPGHPDYKPSRGASTRKQRTAVSDDQIFNYKKWDGEFDYLIIYSYDGQEWEVVDGAHSMEEAQELLGEYQMAYGPDANVQIHDESYHGGGQDPYGDETSFVTDPGGGYDVSRFDRPPGIYGSIQKTALDEAEYFIPVTSAQLDPEVITWFHSSMGDPVYAIGSRLFSDRPANVGRTKASIEELQALESTLERYLQNPAEDDSEEDVARIQKLLANTKKILETVASGRFEKQESGLEGFDMSEFVDAYIEAALWSTLCPEEDDCENLDENYGPSDLSQECLQSMKSDCQKFVQDNADVLAQIDYEEPRWSKEAMAGHDFWLTREGHGVGFWDRGLGDLGDALTKASEAFGEVYLYPGDDGQLYC